MYHVRCDTQIELPVKSWRSRFGSIGDILILLGMHAWTSEIVSKLRQTLPLCDRSE